MAKDKVKRKQESPQKKPDRKTPNPGADTTFNVGDHWLVIPAGAADVSQEFTLQEPSSKYFEVLIEATKNPGYKFKGVKPVLLTLSYKDPEKDPQVELFIYETDANGNPQTKLVENHKHDRVKQTVTARLRHLSGYVIAT
jgi:hypothetical protein